ncbi:uncharacterized protein LOC133326055 [Musca vetustissima]|uniref:uncharacterized protein LOC133326055 n=1 Tax=Musca vetustissima TaxID=27455 RepID=UPI002AB654C0|nr:uncharacterized protein LOC133326055 [Musca vetustissima]
MLALLTPLHISALPATTNDPGTSHIVSYVHQRKSAKFQKPGEHNEFSNFDFENFNSNLTAENPEMRGALQQLFGRFVQNLETNLDNLGKPTEKEMGVVAKNVALQDGNSENKEIFKNTETDDLFELQANTLDAVMPNNEQHESQINETMWQRSKQSIPVLESVRHLVNSVRDGALNDTEHVKPERHHLLSMHGQMAENETSPAIETEEEREMINESTDLKFLEVIGSIGSRVWGFFKNIKQVFAASSGSASAALSAQSSSSSS